MTIDNTILTDHFLVELEILSAKASYQDIKRYEKELDKYQRDSERLGYSSDEEPSEPEIYTNYKKHWWNFGDITIRSWCEEWDSERECPIIILDYYRPGEETDQINIRMSKKEWIDLLTKLGVNFVI